MKPMGLSESQLGDLISGQLHGALQQMHARMPDAPLADLLPELGRELSKVVAAAIHANNVAWAAQTERAAPCAPRTSAEFYDHLSECVDGY